MFPFGQIWRTDPAGKVVEQWVPTKWEMLGCVFFCWGGRRWNKNDPERNALEKNEEMSIFRSIKLTFNILLFYIFRVRRFPLKDDNG